MLKFACAQVAKTVGSAISLFLLTAGLAGASTITYSGWYSLNNGPTPADLPRSLTATDWTGVAQSVSLQAFNPALGILTQVTLGLYTDLDSSGSVANNSSGDIMVNQYDASSRVRILALGAAVPATLFTPYLIEADPALVSLTPGTIVTTGSSVPYSVTDSSASASHAYTTGLGAYQGTGNLDFSLFTATHTITDLSGGNLDLTQNTAARAEVTVTYDYTPVPEPATLALIGSALLGLGWWGRTKRS